MQCIVNRQILRITLYPIACTTNRSHFTLLTIPETFHIYYTYCTTNTSNFALNPIPQTLHTTHTVPQTLPALPFTLYHKLFTLHILYHKHFQLYPSHYTTHTSYSSLNPIPMPLEIFPFRLYLKIITLHPAHYNTIKPLK